MAESKTQETAETKLSTGAVATSDAALPNPKTLGAAKRSDVGRKYVVSARSPRGTHRGGHFFSQNPTVYTLTQELADRLTADGLVLIKPFDRAREDLPEEDGIRGLSKLWRTRRRTNFMIFQALRPKG